MSDPVLTKLANALPASPQALHYWQLGHDRGQRLPIGWPLNNRTQRNAALCNMAFGSAGCPPAHIPRRDSVRVPSRLVFTTFGRLTNCLMVTELARWLAEQLNKTLIMPLCSSAENTEQACSAGSTKEDQTEINLLVNTTAVFERGSIGGCLAARAAVDLDEYLQQQRRQRRGDGHVRVQTPLTCVSKDVDSCAWMLATNYQFVGLKLHRYVNFDLAKLVSVWLQYAINQTATHQGRELTPEGLATARSMATVGSLRDLLRRQDLGEPCAAHLITAGCNISASLITGGASRALLPPCMRNCQGVSVFDAAAGDIFVPNLFRYASPTDVNRPALCMAPELSQRAAAQSRTLLRALPGKFICVHWRGGDFLSTMPLNRLRGKSMLSLNKALSDGAFMARAAVRAAQNVGARHVLLLTDARWERTELFSQTLAREGPGINATILSCTDAPPDSEKQVCAAGAAALLLSLRSSFSVHIHRMALGRNVSVEYLSSCPPGQSHWRSSEHPLLTGPPIPCSAGPTHRRDG